jgi:hypothetical protein
MSGKRPSLAESMRAVAAEPPPPPPSRPTSAPSSPEAANERHQGFYAATRAGKKKVTATLSPEAHRQFKGLAVDQGGKIEGLLTEAINDLFRKYGKPPIA